MFVCPACLRLLDVSAATQGHYPAQSVAAVRRHTELLCSDCNAFCGSAFEDAAAEFWQPLHAGRFSMPGTGAISGKVTVEEVGGVIRLGIDGKGRMKPVVDQWRAHAADPHTLKVSLSRPLEVSVRRSLLSWSYLAWVYFAGYLYADSDGAALVRGLILEPERTLPATIFVRRSDFQPPLPNPEPALLFRVGKVPPTWPDDFVECYGLGVLWGTSFVVMPFANDNQGTCWERVAEMRTDPDAWLVEMPLRAMFDVARMPVSTRIDKGIRAELVLEQDGVRKVVAQSIDANQARVLAAGQSPHRIESHVGRTPPAAPRRYQDFDVTEGRPPRQLRRHPPRPIKRFATRQHRGG